MIKDLTEFKVLVAAWEMRRFDALGLLMWGTDRDRGIRLDDWRQAEIDLYMRDMVDHNQRLTPKGLAELRRFASRHYGGLGSGG